MINLVAAFRAVVEGLERLEIPYVVVGSTAAASWGVVRATRDVDLVTLMSSADAEKLFESFGADLYVPLAFAREAVVAGKSFNVLHTSSGGKVDVFVSLSDDAFSASRFSRAVRSDVLGIPAWVASPEDIVLAKLRWRLVSRSEVQWRDCVEIVAIQPLDREYLWLWAPLLGVESDLQELLGSHETRHA
jgi:hypothetical protein